MVGGTFGAKPFRYQKYVCRDHFGTIRWPVRYQTKCYIK